MTTMSLEALQPNDFDFCWSVLETWPAEERQNLGFGQSAAVVRDYLDRFSGVKALWGPEKTPCGFCFLQQQAPEIAEILMIVMQKAIVSQGLGGCFLRAVVDDLQKKQFAEVWLEVHARNQRALALYQKMGFQITSRRPRYYPDGADALNLNLAFN